MSEKELVAVVVINLSDLLPPLSPEHQKLLLLILKKVVERPEFKRLRSWWFKVNYAVAG